MQIYYHAIAENQSQNPYRKFISVFARVVLLIWSITVIVGGAFLMVDHWVTLPIPLGGDPKLAQAIDDSRNFDERGQWLAVHILYSKCTCSKRIVDHLFSKSRSIGIKEKLIIVDGDRPEWVALAKVNGFSVEVISPKELHSTFNIQAAPIMVVADPLGKVHYAGGYTTRKQGPDIKDLDIIHQLINENPVTPIPLFGCAVAKELQKLADPFGLKY